MINAQLIPDLAVSLSTKDHTITSGLSAKLGGGNEGPNPHEIVEAALAACTIQTCQLYAKRKGWNLLSMKVSVNIQSESKEESIILREITFEGDLSEEQRARLFEIANKCPIHNLLESKITIDSKLKE